MFKKMLLAISMLFTGVAPIDNNVKIVNDDKGNSTIDMTIFEVEKQWFEEYEKDGYESYNSIIESKNGGFICVGETTVIKDGVLGDGLIVKYSDDGSVLWETHLLGDDTDYYTSVIEDDNGDIYVIGKTFSGDLDFFNDNYYPNAIIVKYSSDGKYQWIKNYNDGGRQITFKDIVYSDNELFVVGEKTYNGSRTGYLKIVNAETGLVQKTVFFESDEYNTNLNSIIKLKDGSFLLVGNSVNKTTSKEYPLAIKIQKSGTKVWTYDSSENKGINKEGRINSALELEDGSILLSGFTKDDTRKSSLMVKLNNDGGLVFENEEYEDCSEETKFIGINANKEIITTGQRTPLGKYSLKSDLEIFVKKYDEDGEFINQSLLNDYKNMKNIDTLITSKDELVVVGESYIEEIEISKCNTRNVIDECLDANSYVYVGKLVNKCTVDKVPVLNVLNKTITINVGEIYNVMDGVTATEDGINVLHKVSAVPDAIDTQVKGQKNITYTLSGECGTVTETRMVNIIDPCDTKSVPVISIQDKIVTVNKGDIVNVLDGVTATDDGNNLPMDRITATPSSINTDFKGNHTITYTIDYDCGTVTATKTINVIDPCDTNALPVININDKTVTVNKGDIVNVLDGVTATDDGQDLPIDRITATPSTIDTSEKGKHVITYTVSDDCGETIETKTINVIDPCDTNALPVITVANKTVTVNKGDIVNVLDGVTATDDGNSLPMDRITATPNKIDTSEKGKHVITYKVIDDCGETTETKTINVIDPCDTNALPVITVANKTVTVNKGDIVNVLDGVTATDDGQDLPIDRITATPSTIDTSEKGKHVITYTVSDDCGKTIETKTINVVDPCDIEGSPVINVKNEYVVLEQGVLFDIKEGVSVEKNGVDLKDKLVIIPEKIDTNVEGSIEVTYKIDDDCGEVVKKIMVVVAKNPCDINELPIINIDDLKLEIELGKEFNPLEGVTAIDKEDGDITDRIKVIKNDVKTDSIGEYEVVYSVMDDCGLNTEKIILIKVVDNPCNIDTKPEIIVSDKEIILGQKINPLEWAKAKDGDKDLTTNIKIKENTIDINKVGEYKVVYTVSDECNSVEKEIKVKVSELPEVKGEEDENVDEDKKDENNPIKKPQTGDNTIVINAIMVLISFIGLVLNIKYKKI